MKLLLAMLLISNVASAMPTSQAPREWIAKGVRHIDAYASSEMVDPEAICEELEGNAEYTSIAWNNGFSVSYKADCQ